MPAFAEYVKTAISVDNVIFGFDEGDLKVLLIKRGAAPYDGMWALPGDLVNPKEDIDAACTRVLSELTGIQNVFLEQVHTFGRVDRHPLGRVITVAYIALIKIADYQLTPASFAQQASWHSFSRVGDLAFDHNEILTACYYALRQKVRIKPIGFELLPERFTLTQLQHLYEAVLETDLDKRNFRKKITSMTLLTVTFETQDNVSHRPAKLYQFDKSRYKQFVTNGFIFDI